MAASLERSFLTKNIQAFAGMLDATIESVTVSDEKVGVT